MDSFYIIVACVAIVLLILLLTVIGLMMSNQNRIDVYPPNKSICPDYWKVNSDGKCIANIQGSVPGTNGLPSSYNGNLGIARRDKSLKNIKIELDGSGLLIYDFSGNTVCDNKKWANNNNIEWDGYSNAVTC